MLLYTTYTPPVSLTKLDALNWKSFGGDESPRYNPSRSHAVLPLLTTSTKSLDEAASLMVMSAIAQAGAGVGNGVGRGLGKGDGAGTGTFVGTGNGSSSPMYSPSTPRS